jgi:hypothetical protein
MGLPQFVHIHQQMGPAGLNVALLLPVLEQRRSGRGHARGKPDKVRVKVMGFDPGGADRSSAVGSRDQRVLL